VVNSTVNDHSNSLRESIRVTHLKTCLKKDKIDDLLAESYNIMNSLNNYLSGIDVCVVIYIHTVEQVCRT
jgi:hypothetical protein